ncbi:ABC transporter ATP-binding protein [Rhizobium sp. CG5]|nr:ABC transporter ATP-binding protein [Rhizobium sp. CG5]
MRPDMDNAISVRQVYKRFGFGPGAVVALDGLSLEIPRGKIHGLLGPNGAGKSTLLRIIAGLVRADRGSIDLFGAPASPASRRKFGMLIESPSFYPFMTAREHLAMLASFADQPAEVDAVLRRVGILNAADKRVSGFSLGMKQRLGIGCALISRPDGMILDEPTNGLDPDGILEMRALIQELAHQDGITVLLSSHLLDEVERMCERITIIKRGKLVAEGNVADLLDRQGRFFLEVDRPEALIARLGETASAGDGGVYVRTARDEVPALISTLAASGLLIYEAKWIRPDLEQVFLSETRNVGDDAAGQS